MPVVVLMKDGREAANTTRALREDLRQSIEAMLTGADVSTTAANQSLVGRRPSRRRSRWPAN